ncbi:17805_t:CDS:2 [Funneliformis geosporum]|uniref:5413_t:CDS:1 n=1 Tax=Funneliformis geosporum TaxID=1117311 RepID=A0A9W4SPQ3_9GLOM|nr:17805_t:CDS:2 [Funneliformis geosporum]CAI2177048.1 5413_t:CDS:2 [Funneliformis geosporum]
MRPDEYKQAQARKYQAKLRSRGSSESSKEVQEKRKERSSKSRGGFQHKGYEEEAEEIEEYGDKRQNFRRRKVESNSYRYKDISDTEETTDGIDLETRDFLQMIDVSETRSLDPSTYFQFKEEKDWETSIEAVNESDEIYQNLMNISFDALELSLSNVSLAERLNLSDDIFMEGQENEFETGLESSLEIAVPIVPKTVKTDVQKSILKNVKTTETSQTVISNVRVPASNKIIKKTPVSTSKIYANPEKPTSTINNDDDIDDFLKSLDDKNGNFFVLL